MSNDKITVYTIGHSNSKLEDVAKLLMENGITILLDVRSQPYSKYAPEFNRRNLEKESERFGFEYRFAGDYLGGRPKDKSCYDGDKVSYEKLAEKELYKRGINRLIEISSERSGEAKRPFRENRTAIMCSEEKPEACHRHHLIAQTLLKKGVEVLHIRHSGKVEKFEPDNQLLLF